MTGNPSQNIYIERHARLAAALESANLHALAVLPGATLTYLTGLHFHLMERPTVILFVPHAPPVIILPELETGKTKALGYPVQIFPYGEDPQGWPAVFREAAAAAGIAGQTVGVEPRGMRFLELRMLEAAAPAARFEPANAVLNRLRTIKDAAEVAAMRTAVDIAQRALLATIAAIETGATEREVAAELTLQLVRAGSDAQIPFAPIVASGPNAANPHAVPTSRRLQPGDLLIIDWGASYEGYISDLTRTFAIGEVDAELQKIHQVVEEANAAARQVARPGLSAGQVDAAARQVIEQAGYGQYFIHRTGHGIGMEGHEEPYIFNGNSLELQPGMAFTIEPGIYLPGRGGVRIEDNAVITQNGVEILSDLPRQLQTIP